MLISLQGNGQLAQPVEQRPEKPRVRSSILRLPTIFFFPNLPAIPPIQGCAIIVSSFQSRLETRLEKWLDYFARSGKI
jgi:hypothetical protein